MKRSKVVLGILLLLVVMLGGGMAWHLVASWHQARLNQALFAAINLDDANAVRSLLAEGASANAIDSNGQTALMVAVAMPHTDMAQLLLERGANVNARDGGEWTPLIWAAFHKEKENVQLLLEHGADVHAEGMDWTALSAAQAQHSPDIVALLKKAGAEDKAGTADNH